MRLRIHQIVSSHQSEPPGSADFIDWERRSRRVANYARKMGFTVMYENADDGDEMATGGVLTRDQVPSSGREMGVI